MKFLEKLGILSQLRGGGGLANPKFFKPKPHGDFVGIWVPQYQRFFVFPLSKEYRNEQAGDRPDWKLSPSGCLRDRKPNNETRYLLHSPTFLWDPQL